MRIYDNSLTPEVPKTPDFGVSTVYYQLRTVIIRDGLGNDENYFWKTAKETKLDTSNGINYVDHPELDEKPTFHIRRQRESINTRISV